MADRGEATALVDWTGVSTLAGQQVSYVADDRMRIDFSVPIGRLSIDGYITGRPQLDVDAQTITVADPQVNVASVDVPQAVVDAVSRIVLQPIPIQNLPYDISVTGLTVQPDGVWCPGTGQDIPLGVAEPVVAGRRVSGQMAVCSRTCFTRIASSSEPISR